VYGVGKGRILLDDVHCSGTEKSIFECSHGRLGINNCGHSEDVAISCFNKTGCRVCGAYVGCLVYGDDIVLLSASMVNLLRILYLQ